MNVMTGVAGQQLRATVHGFMERLQIPAALRAHVRGQSAGDVAFNHRWYVHGDHTRGLEASVSDHDDVIEFGLLERDGEMAINVLHATLVLEDDESELNCMSEPTGELNFDVYVTPDKRGALDLTLDQFAQALLGAEG